MTQHETMNSIIHAALRRDLGRFDLALEAFPAGSRRRGDQLVTAWDNYAFQLHHHHVDEETIFWPALRSLDADETLMESLEGEHAQMLDALDLASTSMRGFHADPSAQNAATTRSAIAHLASVLNDHLAHEERDLEPFAAAQRAAPPMKAGQKLVRKAHRGNQGTFFAWLLDGADADAIRGLRREIPRPVLFVITRTAGRRYSRTIAPVWA